MEIKEVIQYSSHYGELGRYFRTSNSTNWL